MTKRGRPKSPPSKIISISTDDIGTVEKIIGRRVGKNQKPVIKIRVSEDDAVKIRKAIKKSPD